MYIGFKSDIFDLTKEKFSEMLKKASNLKKLSNSVSVGVIYYPDIAKAFALGVETNLKHIFLFNVYMDLF